MKIYLSLLFMFAFLIFSAQMSRKDRSISCNIKKLSTHCLENPGKIISQISGYDYKKYFGRYEDFKEIIPLWQIKQISENVKCYSEDSIRYNEYSSVEYSYDAAKGYGFYYLKNKNISYKGTEKIMNFHNYYNYKFSSNKNYLLFYNKQKEHDDQYEVYYSILDAEGSIKYIFHQRGNEFDEFIYKDYDEFKIKPIEENPLFKRKIYKNGKLNSVIKLRSDYKTGDVKIIKTYTDKNSYVLDSNGNPVLTKSKFSDENNECECKKGFVTKIKFQPEDECANKVFYD